MATAQRIEPNAIEIGSVRDVQDRVFAAIAESGGQMTTAGIVALTDLTEYQVERGLADLRFRRLLEDGIPMDDGRPTHRLTRDGLQRAWCDHLCC